MDAGLAFGCGFVSKVVYDSGIHCAIAGIANGLEPSISDLGPMDKKTFTSNSFLRTGLAVQRKATAAGGRINGGPRAAWWLYDFQFGGKHEEQSGRL